MRKVKGVFRNEKWANKILFTAVIAILVVLVGSWTSLAVLPDLSVNFINTGYGIGYFQQGYRAFGYHTYAYQPIRDYVSPSLKPNGSLIKTAASPTVYWINEGMKRNILTPVAFNSWGLDWGSIVTISAAEMSAYEIPVPPAPLLMRPGTLVRKLHDPRVYLFGFDDTLHWITSIDTFNNLALNPADIFVIDAVEFSAYTLGTNLDASDIIAPGSLVMGSSSPAVYLWDGSGTTVTNYRLDLIRTPTAFNSWSFNWASIILVPDAELNAYLAAGMAGTDLRAMPGTLLQGSTPDIYVTDYMATQEITALSSTTLPASYAWKKRYIPSMTAFSNKGYLVGNIMTEMDSEIATYVTDTSVQ